MICRYFDNDLDRMINASREELETIDGVGTVIADSFVSFFENQHNKKCFEHLLNEIQVIKPVNSIEQSLEGIVFVITGSLNHFENRN